LRPASGTWKAWEGRTNARGNGRFWRFDGAGYFCGGGRRLTVFSFLGYVAHRCCECALASSGLADGKALAMGANLLDRRAQKG